MAKQSKPQIEVLPLQPVLLTVKDAAALTSYSEWYLYQLINRGQIQVVRFSTRDTRIPLQELHRLAASAQPLSKVKQPPAEPGDGPQPTKPRLRRVK